MSSHIAAVQVIRYKLHVALRCLSFPYLTRLVACQNAVFLQCLGALETRHGNREFRTVAGGGFLISEREFPVALVRKWK